MATLNTLEEIKQANRTQLGTFYQEMRGEFSYWVKKYYSADEDMAGEVFQRAFITFYYNIKDEKITKLTSTAKTYLFAIGKNYAREQLRGQARFVPEENVQELDNWDLSEQDTQALNERQQQLKSLLLKMGEPCKTVLELFYFQNYSLEAVATTMNYKSENIAAKRKFICLQQIRSILKKTPYFSALLQ